MGRVNMNLKKVVAKDQSPTKNRDMFIHLEKDPENWVPIENLISFVYSLNFFNRYRILGDVCRSRREGQT